MASEPTKELVFRTPSIEESKRVFEEAVAEQRRRAKEEEVRNRPLPLGVGTVEERLAALEQAVARVLRFVNLHTPLR